MPPTMLCFRENCDETLQFFADLRERAKILLEDRTRRQFEWISQPRGWRGQRVMKTYLDFSQIEHISTSAAVILAAEYDRLRTLMDKVPPPIDLHKWSNAVFYKLLQLGFFDIIGLTGELGHLHVDDGVTKTMHIITGSDGEGLERAARGLLELATAVTEGRGLPAEIETLLNTALSEAMTNVPSHAYPEDYPFDYRHVGRWWVTAEVDRGNGTLTLVIYDQGATIPITYPTRGLQGVSAWAEEARDFLGRAKSLTRSHDFDDDGAFVEAAMRYGNTQTNETFRGKGTANMKELIDVCGQGRLTIFSRGGRCEYSADGGTERSSYPFSIGGTLVEWVLQLPGASDA